MCDTTFLTLQSEEKFCRICHDDQGYLLKVCNCKGSIGLVHMECHEKWLQFLKAAIIVISVDMNLKLLWMMR